MLDNLIGFHIEPTNMCTLKCPRCARTSFIEKFPKQWTNKNLNLDHLKSFLDIDLTGKIINLCGNYGDPIYYDQLFEMIKYFKEQKCLLKLSTNGSYKTKEWWQQLVSLLDEDDVITFAIDGTPDNFTQYRVNADWKSIQQGIEVVANSRVKSVWKYIPFSFNEDVIDQAKQLSIEFDFDEFLISPSDRWEGSNDWLLPSKYNKTFRSDSIINWKEKNQRDVEIQPKCKKNNTMHYISAWGYYMPCCFVGDHRFYYKSEFYKNRDFYDISKTTITKILQSTQSIEFYNTVEDAKLNYCTFNCPKL